MNQDDPITKKLLKDIKDQFMKDGVMSPIEKDEYDAVAKKIKKLGDKATKEDVFDALTAGFSKHTQPYLEAAMKGEDKEMSVAEQKDEDHAAEEMEPVIQLVTNSKLKSRGGLE